MKGLKLIFCAVCLLFSAFTNHAQIYAGLTLNGFSEIDQEDGCIKVSESFISEEKDFDLDGDGLNDFKIYLEKGVVENDTPNILLIGPLHNNIRFCAYNDESNIRVKQYEFEETLECINQAYFAWDNNFQAHLLGVYEGMDATNVPSEISNTFVHYRMLEEDESFDGWLNLSFDLTDSTIWVNFHSFLSPDVLNEANAFSSQDKLELYPNPVKNGVVFIESTSRIKQIDIFTIEGKLLKTISNSSNQFQPPSFSGPVMVRIQTKEGVFTKMLLLQ